MEHSDATQNNIDKIWFYDSEPQQSIAGDQIAHDEIIAALEGVIDEDAFFAGMYVLKKIGLPIRPDIRAIHGITTLPSLTQEEAVIVFDAILTTKSAPHYQNVIDVLLKRFPQLARKFKT